MFLLFLKIENPFISAFFLKLFSYLENPKQKKIHKFSKSNLCSITLDMLIKFFKASAFKYFTAYINRNIQCFYRCNSKEVQIQPMLNAVGQIILSAVNKVQTAGKLKPHTDAESNNRIKRHGYAALFVLWKRGKCYSRFFSDLCDIQVRFLYVTIEHIEKCIIGRAADTEFSQIEIVKDRNEGMLR